MNSSVIRVTISDIDYENVCDYYNIHKNQLWNPIRKLYSLEGGFCIDRTDEEIKNHNRFSPKTNIHGRIKQLRWNNRILVTPISFYSFTIEELSLLFTALTVVHGKDNVFLDEYKIR